MPGLLLQCYAYVFCGTFFSFSFFCIPTLKLNVIYLVDAIIRQPHLYGIAFCYRQTSVYIIFRLINGGGWPTWFSLISLCQLLTRYVSPFVLSLSPCVWSAHKFLPSFRLNTRETIRRARSQGSGDYGVRILQSPRRPKPRDSDQLETTVRNIIWSTHYQQVL